MKNSMKSFVLPVLVSIFLTPAAAQAPMGLDECMDYAVEHSPAVAQAALTNADYRQDFIESVADLAPSVGASSYAYVNYGRSIDPETNTYTTNGNFSNAYSVSGSVPVFAGLSGINTVRMRKVIRAMGGEALQQVKDQVAVNTMKAYFDVVYYTESSRLAEEQLETSRATLERTEKQFELGLKSAADVAEIESQVASNDFLLTRQRNELALAEITLRETMNWPDGEPLAIDTGVAIDVPVYGRSLSEVTDFAVENHPKALEAQYDVRSKRLNLSVARGRMWPSVSFSSGYSTDYFTSLEDDAAARSFRSQFRDNRGYYFQFNMNIPIFNGLSRRTSRNRARNALRSTEQRRTQTLNSLRSEVAQAYQQMQGFGKEYVQAVKKTAAAELAHKAVVSKFEKGLMSALDVQTSADKLLEARAQKLQARLQYIIKYRLVEWYDGKPLIR